MSSAAPDPRPAPDARTGPRREGDRVVHSFVVDGPLDVNVQNLRGDLTVRAEPGTAARVELTGHDRAGRALAEQVEVRCGDGRLTVDPPAHQARRIGGDLRGLFRGDPDGSGESWVGRLTDGLRTVFTEAEGFTAEIAIVVVVPAGSAVVANTGVGDLDVRGALRRIDARTGAGDLHLERGGDEQSRLTTGTGDIHAGSTASDLRATTGTGDVHLDHADGHVSVTTGVGDVHVRRARSGRIAARSGAGDVTVRVTRGTATRIDLATGLGEREVQLDPVDGVGDAERALEIEARTGTGDLRVLRARD